MHKYIEFQKALGEREVRKGRREGKEEGERRERKDTIAKVHRPRKCEIQTTKFTHDFSYLYSPILSLSFFVSFGFDTGSHVSQVGLENTL